MFNNISYIWFGWILGEVIKLNTEAITKDMFIHNFYNISIYTAIIMIALKLEFGK